MKKPKKARPRKSKPPSVQPAPADAPGTPTPARQPTSFLGQMQVDPVHALILSIERRKRRQPGPRYSFDLWELAHLRRDQGLNISEIAARLKKDRRSVQLALKKLGL